MRHSGQHSGPGGRAAWDLLGLATVGMRRFDRKFGADLVRELPESPAVYLFKDEAGRVLYAGKSRNIRRRLASYRTASRRKAHRKMRLLVREAHSLEVRLQDTEREALLAENELIRSLRPRYNVDGAFDFLYPAIGAGRDGDRVLLAISSRPEAMEQLGLRWHGSFRPRLRARAAFDALADLVGRCGHVEPRSRLPGAPRPRGSRLVAVRRVPPDLLEATHEFLSGTSNALLARLIAHLLESRQARTEAEGVQEALDCLDDFWKHDISGLRDALRTVGRPAGFVPRGRRDALFIEARLARGVSDGAKPPPG